MRHLGFLVVSAAAAWAQFPGGIPIPFDPIPPQVRQFLQLTDDQVRKIAENNREFSIWSAQKQRRMNQVQAEIQEETAREPLNPGALGARYVELEVIRREIADREKQLRPANVAVLNDGQKMRLQALEEARKLQPVIAGAQSINLLECPPAFAAGQITAAIPDFASLLLGNAVSCGTSFNFRPFPAFP